MYVSVEILHQIMSNINIPEESSPIFTRTISLSAFCNIIVADQTSFSKCPQGHYTYFTTGIKSPLGHSPWKANPICVFRRPQTLLKGNNSFSRCKVTTIRRDKIRQDPLLSSLRFLEPFFQHHSHFQVYY